MADLGGSKQSAKGNNKPVQGRVAEIDLDIDDDDLIPQVNKPKRRVKLSHHHVAYEPAPRRIQPPRAAKSRTLGHHDGQTKGSQIPELPQSRPAKRVNPSDSDGQHPQKRSKATDPHNSGVLDAGPMMACAACTNEFPQDKLFHGACEHMYCLKCIERLVTLAIDSEQQYPPRCCTKTIPIEPALKLLSSKIVKRYQDKTEEYQTPAEERIYCHVPRCSAFIPLKRHKAAKNNPSRVVATCSMCRARTCTTCKKAAHKKEPCPEDEAVKALFTLAERERWKQCGKCKMMVERVMGCAHIRCRCGHRFCYDCGGDWPNCSCRTAQHEWLVRAHPPDLPINEEQVEELGDNDEVYDEELDEELEPAAAPVVAANHIERMIIRIRRAVLR